jgi:hypothetical protein
MRRITAGLICIGISLVAFTIAYISLDVTPRKSISITDESGKELSNPFVFVWRYDSLWTIRTFMFNVTNNGNVNVDIAFSANPTNATVLSWNIASANGTALSRVDTLTPNNGVFLILTLSRGQFSKYGGSCSVDIHIR